LDNIRLPVIAIYSPKRKALSGINAINAMVTKMAMVAILQLVASSDRLNFKHFGRADFIT